VFLHLRHNLRVRQLVRALDGDTALLRGFRSPKPVLELQLGLARPEQQKRVGLANRSCLSSGGKVQRVIIRRPDVTYATFFTCPRS
jgi:hypothetical protein